MSHKKILIALLSFGTFATTPANGYTIHSSSRYTGSWATDTSVNLYRCSSNIIRSQAEIERFIRNLCNTLGLTRSGNTQFLYHYAGNGYTSGLSAIQQANGHTSISIHIDELNNDLYLNFFSCATYDPYDIARRAQDYFIAYDMTYEAIRR